MRSLVGVERLRSVDSETFQVASPLEEWDWESQFAVRKQKGWVLARSVTVAEGDSVPAAADAADAPASAASMQMAAVSRFTNISSMAPIKVFDFHRSLQLA